MNPPNWLGKYPVLPIINKVSPDQALAIAEALSEGGVGIMEITLRTDEAKDSLLAVRREFPEFILGAGSILNSDQLEWVSGEGMEFAVAPGWSDKCWQKAVSLKLPFIPGILSPSELLNSIGAGCLLSKIFPIEPVGGLEYLRALLAPFRKLNFQCLPTGGIKEKQVSQYLEDPQVIMVGGSWLTPSDLIEKKDMTEITKLAKSSLFLANKNQ